MAQTTRPPAFPWVPLVITLVAIGLFWVLPAILGDRPLEVAEAPSATARP